MVPPTPLAKFSNSLKGHLVLPGDSAYAGARRIASMNPTTDRHPQMIVYCAEPEDVVCAVAFAREQTLEVAVRSGGHDLLGASVCEGGMVIDLSPLKDIKIDAAGRTGRVQAGVRGQALNTATQSHGLAAVLGCNPAVGVAGLTLGGGLGWFVGKHGATCDNLLGADIVTADGKMLRADAQENPDLFWAIRGGGGNFGIATAFDYRLHPVGRVLGGMIAYRTPVGEFLRFYRDFMQGAPDELAIELNMTVLGAPTILAIVCWSGDAAAGERVLRPLRAYGPPLADAVDLVDYDHLTDRPGQSFGMRLFGPGGAPRPPQPNETWPISDYWRGGSLRELSDAAAAQIAMAVERAPEGWSIGLGHYMHGAVCRADADATPLPRTKGQFTYFFDAHWRNPDHAAVATDWVETSLAAMRPYSSAGTYINYLSSDSEAAVKASYAGHYARLATLKRQYDPSNFFHGNRNIKPAMA
jgi:FAD/FMN-containing dehydrogenase